MTQKGRNYYEPLPLDFAILAEIPEKAILGGVHWAGQPVRYVRDSINEALADGTPPMTSAVVQSRLRSMAVAGYVENFPATGGSRIWARTPEGTAFLATRGEVLGA